METIREACRGQWKRPLAIVCVLVAAALTFVTWAIYGGEHVHTLHPSLYAISADQRTLQVAAGPCLVKYTSVRADETSTKVLVYIRGKGGESDLKCLPFATVNLLSPLGHRTVIDGSTNRPVHQRDL